MDVEKVSGIGYGSSLFETFSGVSQRRIVRFVYAGCG